MLEPWFLAFQRLIIFLPLMSKAHGESYLRAQHRSSLEIEDLVLALQKLTLWLEKCYIQTVFNFVTFVQPHFQVRH